MDAVVNNAVENTSDTKVPLSLRIPRDFNWGDIRLDAPVAEDCGEHHIYPATINDQALPANIDCRCGSGPTFRVEVANDEYLLTEVTND